jgi:hypothetical protein
MEYIYKNDKDERIILNFPIGTAPSETVVEGVKFERDMASELAGKQFCLKGSGWPGQDATRKKQMTNNNLAAGRRTKDTWGDPIKAVPNYKGKECESWKEAASLSEKDKKE